MKIGKRPLVDHTKSFRINPSKFFSLLISAIFGYAFAILTIKSSIITDSAVEDDTHRFSRSLFSQAKSSSPESSRTFVNDHDQTSDQSQPINSPCECQTNFKSNYGLKVNYFPNGFESKVEFQQAQSKRKLRLEKWKKREAPISPVLDGTILSTSFIPISFPYHGLQVLPLHELNIPNIQISSTVQTEKNSKIKNSKISSQPMGCEDSIKPFCLNIYAHYGQVYIDQMPHIEQKYNGNDKKSLTIETDEIEGLNFALESLKYKSTKYEPKGSTDILTVRFQDYKAQIPIEIRYPQQPVLFNSKNSKLENLVTICIKTFERYPCLRRLIESIESKYPKINIIIADDSFNYQSLDETKNYQNVVQYQMPGGTGFNKGKNLAISQVTTEYLLWIDDDFVFSDETDLEWMLDVLENTNLDIVGGKAGSTRWGYTSILERVAGDSSGDCLYRLYGSRGAVPEYPTCKLADVIQNFYLARTLSLRSVGFDGTFERIAHKEFFTDGIGKLKIAFCSNIAVKHDHQCLRPAQAEQYQKYRNPNELEYAHIDRSWYHRSNFKCISEKKTYGSNHFLKPEFQDENNL